MRKHAITAALLLGAALVRPGLAQTSDISPDHWAYKAVQDLAAKARYSPESVTGDSRSSVR